MSRTVGSDTRGEVAGQAPDAWRVAQFVGVVLTFVLLAGLLGAPGPTLDILWNAVIPLLPALFLVQPEIWRNTCPLATLNVLSGRRGRRRSLSPDAARRLGAIGILLLFTMVPARRYLFNTDGTALAVTIIAVAGLAFALGLFFNMKAGFCNAVCPVLPVERLYGQRPLLRVRNAHCRPCTLCTHRGCLDVAPKRSIEHAIGDASHSVRWLLTPYGIFTAAFPGFVIGYYTTTDVALSAAGSVYVHVGLWMLGSFVVTAVLVLIFRISGGAATLPIAAVSIALYYWFVAPVVAEALGLPTWSPGAIRSAAFVLVAVWLWQARGDPRQTRAHRSFAPRSPITAPGAAPRRT